MKIFGDSISGNCLKVKYTADHLELPYEWQELDILHGASRTPEFLAINPQGQVPAIQLASGESLAQSNAIIRYLANGSPLLPDSPLAQARVDEWLFWEQYSHEPYIAVCRFHMRYMNRTQEELEEWRVSRGEDALKFMESQLTARTWLANDTFSIADISLLAYTRLAHEGGFSLSERPNIRRWIDACEKQLGIT